MNIFFMITSPTPGTFVIALHFKGRDKPILEMDLKIDDLLEKVSLPSDGHVLLHQGILVIESNSLCLFASTAKGQQCLAGFGICAIECT